MPELVIPAPTIPTIPTSTGGAFPVRRVYCIGRNYAAHVVEMGGDPDREEPFFFQKNPNAVAQLRAPIYEEKVVDLIIEKAKVTDKAVSKDVLFEEDEMI